MSPGVRALLAALLLAPLAAPAQEPAAAAHAEPQETPRPLALLSFHAAEYPATALIEGVENDVTCDLKLADTGLVLSADCRSDDPIFALKAQEALGQARFSPAPKGSRVRGVTFIYRFAESTARLPPPPELEHFGEVHGLVLVSGERRAVAGAEVVAQGVGVSAIADAKGRFTLRLPPGSHVLVVSAPQLLPIQQRFELQENEQAETTAYLRRKEVGVLSTTVQAEKAKLAPTKTTVVREELRNVPGSQGDPIRVLEDLPGTARIPYTGGQLIVRGAEARDTGAYIDGQRIPVLYHLLQGPSVLGEEMVDKIDFYPGGAGVYFGRNLAGVVAISSRRGDPDRLHGSVAVDLQKSAAFLQGPIGADTQFAVGLRRSYVNPLITFFADPKREVTVPIYWDYQGRFDHKLSERDRLSLTLYGSDDSFTLVGGGRGSVPLSLGQAVGFHRARLAFERQVSQDLAFSVAPVLGFDSTSSRSEGAGAGVFALPQFARNQTLSTGVRGDARYRMSSALELHTGVDILFDRVTYDLDQLFDQGLRGVGAPNAERRALSGVKLFGSFGEFAELEWKIGELRIVPGLRVEELHYAQHTYLQFDPRIWVRYALDPSTTLHAYAGLYHQAPTAEQVDSNIGNPALSPPHATQLGLGGEKRFGDSLSVKAEVYFNIRKALVFPAKAVANGDGTFSNPLQLNSGEGRSLGFELLVRRELTSTIYGWIAYSLSRSRELRGDGTPWRPTLYDQPHVLTVLLGLRPSPYVEFAVRMRVATGNPVAEVSSSVFDADSGSYVPRLGAFGGARLPTFWQLDFELNNVWAADTHLIQLYVDFQNVMNRLNPEILLYDYRYLEQAYVHGLPFTAIVGAKVSF